jgi:hypothetical protein
MDWKRFKENLYHHAGLGVSLDLSRLPLTADFAATHGATPPRGVRGDGAP